MASPTWLAEVPHREGLEISEARPGFTATQAIFIWVGSSFTGSWYSQYNGTFGDFIALVLPGTKSIYISNPSLFFGVTVTLTIEYVY